MNIKLSNDLILTQIPDPLIAEIRDRLTFTNPAYTEAEKMNRWTGNLDRELKFYRAKNGGLQIPRGFTGHLISMAKRAGIPFQIEDRRRILPEVDFQFAGELRDFQQEAMDNLIKYDFATLPAPTGSGKTVIGLALVAARRQPALVIVHTKELLNQWIDRIETFLGIPRSEIGVIGAGKKTIGERITVGIVNSVYSSAGEIREHIGHLIVDECHRTPSRTFTEAVSAFDCRYMLGLSATPYRRDGLSRLIFWHIGDVHHEIKAEDLQETGDILKVKAIQRFTNFRSWADATTEYPQMLAELTKDNERNELITSDVIREADNGGGICLVLTDRREHAVRLVTRIRSGGIRAEMLTGELPAKERQGIVDRLNTGAIKVLVATGQLIGEGFDCRELSTLFLATPIRFDGRVKQYLGRVMRPAPGKDQAVVYDYVDSEVGVLRASARQREKIYGRAET